MTFTRWLRRASLPGLVAAMTMLSSAVMASSLGGSGITFATQSVAGSTNGGTVTIGIAPTSFAGVPVTYTSNSYTSATSAAFSITFTLPTGVTFTNNPSATGDGTVFASTLLQVSGGVGDNFITFTGTANPEAALSFGTVSLGAFNLAGATALASTNTTTFVITASVSSTISALNDAGTKGQLATSESATQVTTTDSLGLAQVIDVTSPSLGDQWKQYGADTLVADDGAVVIASFGGLAEASDAAEFIPASSGTVTLTGLSWGGVSTPFLLTGAFPQPGTTTTSGCPTTPPSGAVTGTVSGVVITFANVTLPPVASFDFFEVCLGVTGKALIAANLTTTAAMTSPAGVTTFAGVPALPLNPYTYNGAVQQVLYSGTFPPYTAYERINNNTGTSADVITVVQPDSGTAAGTTTTTVAANSNVLVAASTLISNSGVTLDSTGRASMLFLTPGTPCTNNTAGQSCPVSVSQLLVNPDGDVAPLGSGSAP
jgi:hypothetical protein